MQLKIKLLRKYLTIFGNYGEIGLQANKISYFTLLEQNEIQLNAKKCMFNL